MRKIEALLWAMVAGLPVAARAQSFSLLHSFTGGTDDAFPGADLAVKGEEIYGTTAGGNGTGTVYTYNLTTGQEAVFYNRGTNAADGSYPEGKLIYLPASGLLYGTTSSVGYCGGGSIFDVDPATGAASGVHYFYNRAGSTDVVAPEAGVVAIGNQLYGTTDGGGAHCTIVSGGRGAVFRVNAGNNREQVAGFTGANGLYPRAGLINVSGVLYGTTAEGGGANTNCGGFGCGTVSSFSTSTHAIAVLHAISGNSDDGSSPTAGVVSIKGVLYGTTYAGGDVTCAPPAVVRCMNWCRGLPRQVSYQA